MNLVEMREKWQCYNKMLNEPEGDGSLVGRYFLIAKSGCSDIADLLDLIEGAFKCEDDEV